MKFRHVGIAMQNNDPKGHVDLETSLSWEELMSGRAEHWWSDAWRMIRYRPLDIIRDPYWWCKTFIQRGRRGYGDRDLWDLFSYHTRVMSGALKQFRSQLHGYPADMASDEEWIDKINQMIAGFDIAKRIDEMDYKNAEEFNELEFRFRTKMQVFIDYYFGLWT